MKKVIYFQFFLMMILISNNYAHTSISNEVIAKVGTQVVSSYELKNKIKTKIFLSKKKINQENINKIKGQILQSLINLKLKKIELLKYNIKIEYSKNLNSYLENIALQYNTNINGLKNIFEDNGLDFEELQNEINTELAWNNFIFRMYKNKIQIDQNEINNQLNIEIKEQKNLEKYKLSEIELLIKDDTDIRDNIRKIKKLITEEGFKNTAIKHSVSDTALDGGDLGWINSKVLSNQLQNILEKMNIGDISEPIIKDKSIVFLKLVNKKTININNIDLNSLKNQIINAKKNELLIILSNNHLSKIKNNNFIKIK